MNEWTEVVRLPVCCLRQPLQLASWIGRASPTSLGTMGVHLVPESNMGNLCIHVLPCPSNHSKQRSIEFFGLNPLQAPDSDLSCFSSHYMSLSAYAACGVGFSPTKKPCRVILLINRLTFYLLLPRPPAVFLHAVILCVASRTN